MNAPLNLKELLQLSKTEDQANLEAMRKHQLQKNKLAAQKLLLNIQSNLEANTCNVTVTARKAS